MTADTAPLIHRWMDPSEVARTIREHDLPGRRTVKQIRDLRRQRAALQAGQPPHTLAERLDAWLLARYLPEIARRGGETGIADKNRSTPLRVLHRARDRESGQRLVLIGADGWRHYSNSVPARHVSLRYLCGSDDSGPWAARVPGTTRTVADAVDAIIPAAVDAARARGKVVYRQGDVYAIETTRHHDAPTGPIDQDGHHRWDAQSRMLTHHPTTGRPHAALHLPHPVRFVQQSTLGMGRGWGRGPGD